CQSDWHREIAGEMQRRTGRDDRNDHHGPRRQGRPQPCRLVAYHSPVTYWDLICSSFCTSFTPLTERASSPARSLAAAESTKPPSCTTPERVSTSIWCALVVSSSISLVFTLPVMFASSTTAPARRTR